MCMLRNKAVLDCKFTNFYYYHRRPKRPQNVCTYDWFRTNKTEQLGVSNSKAANRSRSVGKLLLVSRMRTEGRD